MSSQLKQAVAYWLTLVMGAAILFLQIFFYYRGEIDLNLKELTVTAVGIVLMFKPNVLSNAFRKAANSRFNAKNDK